MRLLCGNLSTRRVALRRQLLVPGRTRQRVHGALGGVERPRRKVRFARLIHRRGRAFWPAFGRRRLRRQSQPDLVATSVVLHDSAAQNHRHLST